MADENPKAHPTDNAEKDPDDWTTGDEAMTGAQASYLKTLSEEAGEPFDVEITSDREGMLRWLARGDDEFVESEGALPEPPSW